MISITEADVLASRKKASMRLVSTKCMVRCNLYQKKIPVFFIANQNNARIINMNENN